MRGLETKPRFLVPNQWFDSCRWVLVSCRLNEASRFGCVTPLLRRYRPSVPDSRHHLPDPLSYALCNSSQICRHCESTSVRSSGYHAHEPTMGCVKKFAMTKPYVARQQGHTFHPNGRWHHPVSSTLVLCFFCLCWSSQGVFGRLPLYFRPQGRKVGLVLVAPWRARERRRAGRGWWPGNAKTCGSFSMWWTSFCALVGSERTDTNSFWRSIF